MALRTLKGDNDPSPSPPADAPLSSDEDSAWFLYALTQRTTGCFFCQEDGHMLADCKKFAAIKDNSFARRQIRRLLDPLSASSSDSPSTRSGPTRRLAQVGFTLAGYPDSGEGDSASHDEAHLDDESDFRDGRY